MIFDYEQTKHEAKKPKKVNLSVQMRAHKPFCTSVQQEYKQKILYLRAPQNPFSRIYSFEFLDDVYSMKDIKDNYYENGKYRTCVKKSPIFSIFT